MPDALEAATKLAKHITDSGNVLYGGSYNEIRDYLIDEGYSAKIARQATLTVRPDGK